jgi:peroxiredoxin Q/BCP
MLPVGAVAPDFEGQSSGGSVVSLRHLRGKAVVLFFYPKAFTPICTVETGRFRDNHADLAALGAEVIGISADALEAQCDFARQQKLPYPLIADTDRSICRAYRVLWPLLPRARRATFIIGETGLIELALHHEFQVSKHLDGVLQHLQKRRPGADQARIR